jgi:hypothetical protein
VAAGWARDAVDPKSRSVQFDRENVARMIASHAAALEAPVVVAAHDFPTAEEPHLHARVRCEAQRERGQQREGEQLHCGRW